ncbi:hypothetical protein K7X08_010826 [Anisodus acutangulus]|uniref:SET domain-containing protein n=1 Tax=Anisodus acutangulus TaxID=402998 RepID=A0A9Q1LXL6_9SOLA|nr:hypothetical protein K7X08_010826 [Anisodus acutangulus]
MDIISPTPLLKIVEIQGRGRSLVSTQPLKPGQIILKDTPLLLYPASSSKTNTFCSNCYKLIIQSPIPCPECIFSFFCTSNCHSISLSSSHTPFVCQSLTHFIKNLSFNSNLLLDQQVQVFYLISAYNLALINPSSFRVLLSLQGDSSFVSENDVYLLHSVVSTICPSSTNLGEFRLSKELTGALLAKDKVNAFGLMEPFVCARERGVRAYGIYPMASFFNHDCLPNACRFEYVDSDVSSGSNNTDMIVRVIHDVDEGREICLSYFPVNFKYSERQQRLKEDYGFSCSCDRCVVEANWSDQEDDDAMDNEGEEIEEEEEDEAMEEDEVIGNGEVEERDQDFPHAYFFIRYMCNKENCWGTLAPLPPSDATPSTIMECNVCGNLSKSDEL